ncbi:MAG: chromosome segregation protein SMC [Alteromonadaceae bacterium]|nr:chromosome segregation protein SMC [Alteromonadaceae bacterium]
MRLKSIKLAGFKSFVDATTVPFPTNMTAIVGPNGCGKSNIIDAVRWVMGESSAKFLRGESMSDVIFNGSHSRQPVGQASIELVFDNSDLTAPGEFSAFTEISVKRRVTREGQSEYFLNGTRCRRRDITDLFLGTGLGPRSYAIIEQGMISRLIEARPEELRTYIEEAAGISRYKERRKETESRMRRTQENLDRLTDLRDELGRQLQHLERQAQSAEKYRAYKKEERQKKAELAVLRWRSLDQERELRQAEVQETELQLEQAVTARVNRESSLESLRQEQGDRSEHFNRAQGRFYEAGADIARVEQSLEHQRQRARQLARELEQALENQQELARELGQDEDRLALVAEGLAENEPALDESAARSDESGQHLQNAEAEMGEWQQRWEEFSQKSAEIRQRAEVEQSRIRNAEDSIQKLQDRQRRQADELELLESQLDRSELDELREECAAQQEKVSLLQESTAEAEATIEQLRDRVQSADQKLNESRGTLQQRRGELASHEAMLAEQLEDRDEAINDWLRSQNMAHTPRLATELQVEPGWEDAVEAVMQNLAQARLIDTLDGVLAEDLPPRLSLVVRQGEVRAATGSLLEKVGGAGALGSLLNRVKCAPDLAVALAWSSKLDSDQSVITPQGYWVGAGWLQTPVRGSGQMGVIERQRAVESLQAQSHELEQSVTDQEASLQGLRREMAETEQQRKESQQAQAEASRALSALDSRIGAIQARSEQIEMRLDRLREDRVDLADQRTAEEERLAEAREIWQEAMAGMEEGADEKETLLGQRDTIRERLDSLRLQARHDRDHHHQLQLQVQALRNQRDGLKTTLDRMSLQRERLDERVTLLREGREEAEMPIEDLALELEGLLERRLAEEEKLAHARTALEAIDTQVRDIEQHRAETEQRIQQIRDHLQRLKMDTQALELRCTGHLEQLTELEVTLQSVIEHLPAEATEEEWDAELQRLANRIQRLGAINLAAIDEYRVQSERKNYLDEQHADLSEALETLEAAIRKIDRETRQRFKETFDKVNQGLQELFPKVFGGGNASLELTGEDLLETGVTIMARPPGKKNSTIHLLSGGEKALTAIALVFSIFQLNPAPFCMLDEVDAPLDDANVGRYATLVRAMASQVQFIYITHNKIAMEMADQLMGVTMHEPGVSRLVSVDVEAAAALAEA